MAEEAQNPEIASLRQIAAVLSEKLAKSAPDPAEAALVPDFVSVGLAIPVSLVRIAAALESIAHSLKMRPL